MRLSAEEVRQFGSPASDLQRLDIVEIGKAQVRIHRHKPSGAYIGVVAITPQKTHYFKADDEASLLSEMLSNVSSGPPIVRGYDGAISRFLYIYPAGFENSDYLRGERDGKLQAGELAAPVLDPQCGLSEAVRLLKQARSRLSSRGQAPVHSMESGSLDRVWSGKGADAYVEGVRGWSSGDASSGLALMRRASELSGERISWPMASLYPALLSPRLNAVLRPTAATVFAEAVGSIFRRLYESDLSVEVYSAYLEMLDETREKLAELQPRDRLDVANFIWISTSYGADTTPRGVAG
jgi:hypothetical protein